ncbi:hypothetical protein D499_0B02720 [Hanseniaspora uvarum DSM 2768]|nr:hypothetical protein D499_0B02720 [Hanseniaspora uvarum DSM 2768]
MTVTKLIKKGYNILLDSGFVENSVCKRLNQIEGSIDYNQKCTLILGSTGAIGLQVVNNIVASVVGPSKHVDLNDCQTTLILIKRKDTFLGESLYAINEYNVFFEEITRQIINIELKHPAMVIHSSFISKRKTCSKVVSVYEIIYPDSSNWSTIFKTWRNNINNLCLPDYKKLTGLVSCLGTTKSKLKHDNLGYKGKIASQRNFDYELNFSLIKAVSNASLKIILLTSFNSYTLGSSVPYFKNKLDVEKDVSSKLEFAKIFIVRPGPYVFCSSNYEIFEKYALNGSLDYRSFMSQIIAYNFYKTHVSKFFGYCVQSYDVSKAIELVLFSIDDDKHSNHIVHIQSKNM